MARLPPSSVDTRSLREKCVDLATKVKGILGISHIPYKDEDDMASDSATHLATQQSIKAYADTKKSKRITIPFSGSFNTGAYSVNNEFGLIVDSAGEYAYTWFIVPDDLLTEITKIRIMGMSKATRVGTMALDIDMFAGTSGEDYNEETVDINAKESVTAVVIINDYVEWQIDKNDDADIGHIAAGDCVQLYVKYVATAGKETSVYFDAIEIEYT